HDWTVSFTVFCDICRIQTFGQHAVGLDRTDLPGAADRVGQVPFELGCVEGAFAGQLLPAVCVGREPGLDHRVAQLRFGLVPDLVAAEARFGTQRQLDRVREAEVLVDAVGELAERLDLRDDL